MSVNMKAVRAELSGALEKIGNAASMMRIGGMPENADELMRSHAHLRVWVQPDGWLDMLEGEKK